MTVYHRQEDFPDHLWVQANPVFGHEDRWTRYCLLCALDGTAEVAFYRAARAIRRAADAYVIAAESAMRATQRLYDHLKSADDEGNGDG